jgi:peptidoglycan L-alanyl-D-glutamate endopeptidase CwlK
MLKLTAKDYLKLRGVHPDLVAVVEEYLRIGKTPIIVIEGLRTLAKQKEYLKKGATTTLRSRHLTGHAIDIGPKNTPLSHWPPYYTIAKDFKQAAKNIGVPVEWGGDWKSFKDGPHWQLPWKKYTANNAETQSARGVPDTEAASAVRKASMFGLGGFSGSSVALSDTVSAISSSVENQQYELTSGETVRVMVGAVILVVTLLGVYFSYKSYKDSQMSPEVG